jgi:NapC/NirT cytochrome c family protein
VSNPRPIAVILTSHPVSLAGTILVTTAGLLWLFALPAQARGHADNPYTGIFLFIILPVLFFAGLALIPIGAALAKRRIAAGWPAEAPDRGAAFRKLALFLGLTTAANVVIGSQLSYRAVEHMETTQFCGQSCHVMTPEYRAHAAAPHSKVACVDCHVSPGATGWMQSKINGTRQLFQVLTGSHPKPIPAGLASGRLVGSAETCESCHARQPGRSVRVRLFPKHADDEASTPSWTVLTMRIGGGKLGGIHGAHLAEGVVIRYAASDDARQTIPWVEVTRPGVGQPTTYLASGADAASVARLPRFTMQCVDCHNRPAHTFEQPERAVDREMALGELPGSLPSFRKRAVELLRTTYASEDAARAGIAAGIGESYASAPPEVVQKASEGLGAIWARNVFPDLGVTWGTYPNNLGHEDTPGCFRCHDGEHSTADGSASIGQDCSSCHEAIAVEEASPEILTTLGLSDLIAKLGSQSSSTGSPTDSTPP